MGYIDQIMHKLLTDDGETRRRAVKDLSQANKPEAILELLVALHDPLPRIREESVDVLGSLPAAATCGYLLPLLASENAILRGYVIEILEAYEDGAEPYLIEATLSTDEDIRKFALDMLIKIARKNGQHSEQARKAVVKCFDDSNLNVAGSAIEALGYSNNRDYLPLFSKILKSESPWIQCAAISSIVRLVGDDAGSYFATVDRSKLSEEAQIFLQALLPGESVC